MNRRSGNDPNNRSGSPKRKVFGVLLALALVPVAWGMDYAYGQLSGIASIREDARKFRAEAAPLRMTTRALLPSIEHNYGDPYRPEGHALVPVGQARRFATDSVGAVAVTQPPSTERILFLGGSTTECNEVDEPFRFPAMVGRLLREQNAKVETINAGVRGHTTLDAINTLLNRPELGDAQTVVLMENINDRLLLAIRNGYGSAPGREAPTTGRAVLGAASATMIAAWEYLAYRSNALFFAMNSTSWFGRGATSQGYVTERTLEELPPPTQQQKALYEANLKVFVAAVRALGRRPVLMTQALGTRSVGQEMFNESIRKIAGETGTQLIDLDAALPVDRAWAYLDDNIHLSNRGSREVAQVITAELASRFGFRYSRPETDSGLIKLSELADQCAAPERSDLASSPKLHQIVGGIGRYPSVSPDGRWLVYQTRERGLDRLQAQRLSDGEILNLTSPDTKVHERHPAFLDSSEDGFSIVFGHGTIGEQEGQERLMVRDHPSGRTRPLVHDVTLLGSIPTVQGQQVLFAGSRDENGSRMPNLYRFDLGTGTVERLTKSNVEQWRPVGSPSGEIYFISDEGGRFAIYRRAITGAIGKVVASSADEWDPAVSPDGRWLAFASKRDGNWDVFVQSTSDPRQTLKLTDLSGDEWDPAWHPNGRLILFGSAQEGEPRLMAMCVRLAAP